MDVEGSLRRESVIQAGTQVGVGAAAATWVCTDDSTGLDHRGFTASPMGFVAAEVGAEHAFLFVEAHTAPLLQYGAGACHVPLFPLAMAAAGVWFGTDEVRLGPYASGGLLALEVGGRFAYTPFQMDKPSVHAGVEVRVAWMGDRATMLAAGYTVAWR